MEELGIEEKFKKYIGNSQFSSVLLLWLQELCPQTLELDELEEMSSRHLKQVLLLT